MNKLTKILLINNDILISPLFDFFDEITFYNLMLVNKSYKIIFDDDIIYEHILSILHNKISKYTFEFLTLFHKTLFDGNENIIELTYKDALKTIKNKNFNELYDKLFNTNTKIDISIAKEILKKNYFILNASIFKHSIFCENVFLTIVDSQILFGYKERVKKLMEIYVNEFGQINNQSFGFYVYNQLNDYNTALKYIDFFDDFCVSKYIELLTETKLKSSIDHLYFKYFDTIHNIEIHLIMIYIYFCDKRYNDIIIICDKLLYYTFLFNKDQVIFMKYMLSCTYKQISNELEFFFLNEIIWEILKPGFELHIGNVRFKTNTCNMINKFISLIKYYEKKNNLDIVLNYLITFMNDYYPKIKQFDDCDKISEILNFIIESDLNYDQTESIFNLYPEIKIIHAWINNKIDIVEELLKVLENPLNSSEEYIKYAKLIVKIYKNNNYHDNKLEINKNILNCDKIYISGYYYLDIINDHKNGSDIIKSQVKLKIYDALKTHNFCKKRTRKLIEMAD